MLIINHTLSNKIDKYRYSLLKHYLFKIMGITDDSDIDNDYFLALVIDLENVPIAESNKMITMQYHVGLCKTEWLVFTPY
jgi:hypothetical protein